MIAGYIKAENVGQALQALADNQPWGRVLAGGTDIIQKNRGTRHNKANPMVFVDIKQIEELKGIRMEEDFLVIGANTTLYELINNQMVAQEVPALIEAAEYVGSLELRNRATVGGNICTKNPSADMLVPLLAMDAQVEICDLEGKKLVPLKEIVSTALKGFGRRLLITAIKVPIDHSRVGGYRRWTRESMGRAYLSVMVILDKALKAESDYQLKVVLGGASLWPCSFEVLVPAEKMANNKECLLLLRQIVQEKMGAVDKDAYRLQLAPVLIYEALDIAIKGVK